jgi:PAS domain S-box-containing protein
MAARITRFESLVAGALIVGGLGLLYGQHRLLQEGMTSARDQRLNAAAGHIEASIHASLGRSESAVRALAAFIEDAPELELNRLQRFSAALLEGQAAMRALQWEPRVIQGQRSAFELQWRQRGLADFEFRDASADGLVSARQRPVSYPILGGHAIDSDLPVGLVAATEVSVDAPPLAEEADFVQASTQSQADARDAAAPRLSAVFRAVTAVDDANVASEYQQHAFNLRMPVYALPPGPAVENRRALLQGFAVAFVALPTLLEEARALADAGGLGFSLRDLDSPGAPLIYLHGNLSDPDTGTDQLLQLSGRRWQLVMAAAPPSLLQVTGRRLPSLLGLLVLFGGVGAWLRGRVQRRRLWQERQRLRELCDGLPIGLFQAARGAADEFQLCYVNAGAARLLGQDALALQNAPDGLFEFLPADARASVIAELDASLRGGQPVQRELQANVAGQIRRLQLGAVPGTGRRGRAMLNGVLEDVTQLREASATLEAVASEQAVMVESLPFGLLFADAGQISRANPALAQLLGYVDGEELAGLPLSTLHADEADYRRLRAQAGVRLKAGKIFSTEWTLVRRDGETFRARLVGRKLLDDAHRRELWVITELDFDPSIEPWQGPM